MYTSLKKLFGIIGTLLFLIGSFSWGQTDSTPLIKECGVWAKIVDLCKCPSNTKSIDGFCKPCWDPWVCCGIKLNTNVPFIGNCIELSKSKACKTDADCSWGDTCVINQDDYDKNSESEWFCVSSQASGETTVTEETAFPILMGSLTKILVTIIILIGFIGILIGWVMITASWGSDSGASKGKELIWRVIIALALLGASWVILRLINPNFFW